MPRVAGVSGHAITRNSVCGSTLSSASTVTMRSQSACAPARARTLDGAGAAQRFIVGMRGDNQYPLTHGSFPPSTLTVAVMLADFKESQVSVW